MITNFEVQTADLNNYEKHTLLPAIVAGLKTKKGKDNEITSTEIIAKLKAAGYKIDGARLRKIVNYIRIKNIIYNLIATSKGYFIATNEKQCRDFIKSLDERIAAIQGVRDAMNNQLVETLK